MELGKMRSAAIIGAVLIALLSFQAGYRKGEGDTLMLVAQSELANTTEGQPETVDFAPFWKAWSIINTDYVPTGTSTEVVSDQARVWGAIQGMVGSLGDPYTVFFPPVESEQFAEDIKGTFSGVGMEVGQENGQMVVIAPLKGSPAEAAGMRPGDRILEIDGIDTSGLTVEEAVTLIRGEEGTPVTLKVDREDREDFEVTIVRRVIDIPVIETEEVGTDVFYIAVYSFTENSPNLFRGALREFVESGRDRLVLDLRGNPGGYLEAALDMASWFLPSGAPVIVEDNGPNKEDKIFRSRGYDIFTDELKMAVLIDGGSASASEILAGALSEHGKATLVGAQSFGKGSVQELVPVTEETSLKVTIARWLTPNGNTISETGITPDIEVEMTDEDFRTGNDRQLNRAVEFLRTGR